MDLSIKPRVVLDANVFVSALVWGGNPEKVLRLWTTDGFILFISPEVLLEVLTVLETFGIPQAVLVKMKTSLETHVQKIIPHSDFRLCRDPKDNKYLNLCFDSLADYFVTGDKDLLTLKQFKKTKILKPKEFLKVLNILV